MKSAPDVDQFIVTLRSQKVILDSDLAKLYGVPTKRLNEQFRRNRSRFPEDFAFQLTAAELDSLRSQNATLKKGRGQHSKYRPYAFTEHGALQAANILNSAHAVQMSVYVIRAFVKMREALLETRTLAQKLGELEKHLTGRLDVHEVAIVQVLQELMEVINPPPPPPAPPKPQIGFQPQRKRA